MMNNKLLHTPVGVRDIYSNECEDKLFTEDKIHRLFKSYGYCDIQTPSFEFFDIFNKERGSVASKNMYKFFDREGNTLVLRPDMTPSIARAVTKYYADEEFPIRLCYLGNSFINNSEYQGKLKEFTQIGAELIGDNTSDADAEIIAMIIEALKSSGLKEFQIEIGNTGFLKGVAKKAGLSDGAMEELTELLENKKYFGLEELVERENVPEKQRNVILQFQKLVGTEEMLEYALSLVENDESVEAIKRLQKVYNILKIYGYEKYISFDLSMLDMYQYYTGIVFKGYTYGTGDAVVKGGRYDNLLEQFGKMAPAIGFAINVDSLMLSLMRQHIETDNKTEKKMIIYSEDDREKAINKSEEMRSEGITVLLVRKRSNHSMEEYHKYAERSGVTDIIEI